MKYKNIVNPNAIIEAFKWDPKQPASARPDWFNRAAAAEEVVLESNDSVSLPFPAMRSAFPGEFIVKKSDDQLVAVAGLHGWEPVQE